MPYQLGWESPAAEISFDCKGDFHLRDGSLIYYWWRPLQNCLQYQVVYANWPRSSGTFLFWKVNLEQNEMVWTCTSAWFFLVLILLDLDFRGWSYWESSISFPLYHQLFDHQRNGVFLFFSFLIGKQGCHLSLLYILLMTQPPFHSFPHLLYISVGILQSRQYWRQKLCHWSWTGEWYLWVGSYIGSNFLPHLCWPVECLNLKNETLGIPVVEARQKEV